MEHLVCTSCKKAKFPFCDLDNLNIEKRFFDSSFPCKCSHDPNFTTERGKLTFKYKSSKQNRDNKTKLSKINEFLDEHQSAPNFQYYYTFINSLLKYLKKNQCGAHKYLLPKCKRRTSRYQKNIRTLRSSIRF